MLPEDPFLCLVKCVTASVTAACFVLLAGHWPLADLDLNPLAIRSAICG